MPAPPPFDELRVLDLTTGIAGGYASKLLVDAGADVVIVEPPGGDPLRRRTAASAPLTGDGPLFGFLRAGTRSSTCDPLRAAAGADIVLTNRRLALPRPDAVVVSITPWGTTGPWADRPAADITVQAACGATARRGLPDRPPVSAGGEVVEWLTGAFAAVGALTAFVHARDTGVGQLVDVSMLEVATLCLNGPYTAIAAQWYPSLRQGRWIEVPSIEPAADGDVGFCTMTGQQWTDFCVLIGRPDFADDPTLRSSEQRMARITELRAAIAAAIGGMPVAQVVELAVALRVPVSPIGNGATVTGFDHVVERGVYVRGHDGLRRPLPPYRLSSSALRPFGPPPAAGGAGGAPPWPAREARRGSGGERPFDQLRVVDLSAFWAGPFATLYLGALGADVVKVESTTRPDGIRFLGGFEGRAPWERSMVFHGANPGKRAVTLDLDHDEGLALLWGLIEGADVVIENFTPRVLDRFGITWPAVHARNARAVMVRMPAFGLDGPWRDRAGFAMTIEQTSGLAWVTGYDDLAMVPRGPCDPLGGMHAVLAVLVALEGRRASGEGQLVEVPLLDGALNVAAEQVLEHDRTGEVLARHGNRGLEAPQGVYAAGGEDRWVAIAVTDDDQWARLRSVIVDLPDVRDRRAAHDRLDEVITAWTSGRPAEEAADLLCAAGVPAAALTPSHEAHRNPQLAHRRFLQPLDHPVTGLTGYPGLAMLFEAFGPELYRSPPPLLGQHNREVLGLPDAELDRLAAEGIIGDRPAWARDVPE